jgi:hypothetical protein
MQRTSRRRGLASAYINRLAILQLLCPVSSESLLYSSPPSPPKVYPHFLHLVWQIQWLSMTMTSGSNTHLKLHGRQVGFQTNYMEQHAIHRQKEPRLRLYLMVCPGNDSSSVGPLADKGFLKAPWSRYTERSTSPATIRMTRTIQCQHTV